VCPLSDATSKEELFDAISNKFIHFQVPTDCELKEGKRRSFVLVEATRLQ